MTSVLEINNFTKRFGKFEALSKLNMRVEEGEIFGFIGPNGSGKSTTIKTMLGQLKPSSGNVTLFGKDAFKEAVAIHERIAYVPGDVNLWPNLTGEEVIEFLLSLQKSVNHERKQMLIRDFELDIHKKCSTYSKGNRQKVALIAALSMEVDLYIFDEPTSGLDPLMERVFQHHVKACRKRGKTVLLSSHILSEVEQLCDRVGIIRKGELIETGTLDEMRHLTRMRFTVMTQEILTHLKAQPGVHDVTKQDETYQFQVDTDQTSTVIQYLSRFNIKKLESQPMTLEDLFIRHYGEQLKEGE
ncbi:ABC transporter ATP-binding protein [Staphylococcus simulans]|uniref:ABC transporter ATP-binding protein n=1 Tax=Staphylococcus simulans TaxID=1286 RepID=UPI000D1F33F1|nr:ABC transporter ATP-binding protein [Staphylococcus simulans]PTI94088.1 ABC transporter ATP-binding protein [Staphylococcus simulans]PTJ04369.1 ABC transporter ATP-binding protein [Staphylococcus simulans]PTJ11320.1 ABC transporter ATP-binding protein [Staphylococcus simulans]PTJ39772.1 ABC transporter ATP-binding protein [Staphylococcus simulans]